METYRTKSKQDGWERTIFGSIKDETVDLWANRAVEKKVVIEMCDKVEREKRRRCKSSVHVSGISQSDFDGDCKRHCIHIVLQRRLDSPPKRIGIFKMAKQEWIHGFPYGFL